MFYLYTRKEDVNVQTPLSVSEELETIVKQACLNLDKYCLINATKSISFVVYEDKKHGIYEIKKTLRID